MNPMLTTKTGFARTLFLLISCFIVFTPNTFGQKETQGTPKPTPSPQPEDVIRINTELVQTQAMVFDQKGHLVGGLRRDQFELTVDGKPQPVSLLSRSAPELIKSSYSYHPTAKPPRQSRLRSRR